jgi:hypothetical protein
MTRRRGIAELLLFPAASDIGIYAFGRGLAGFFGYQHADPWWLPAGFAALWVLAKQMGGCRGADDRAAALLFRHNMQTARAAGPHLPAAASAPRNRKAPWAIRRPHHRRRFSWTCR